MGQHRLKLGLKIYMTNKDYIAPALDLLDQGICDFVEITVNQRQTNSDLDACRVFSGKAMLHAPHSYAGLNPASPQMAEANLKLVGLVEASRVALGVEQVIFHPGIVGELHETLRQFRAFFGVYPQLATHVLIENKPWMGLGGEACCGVSPQEIRRIKEELGVGFCLDFGHAICASVGLKRDWPEVIEEFLALKPSHFHLCDGWLGKATDAHLHFGQGQYDIQRLLAYVPDGGAITIEAPHDFQDRLDDFAGDVNYLRERGA